MVQYHDARFELPAQYVMTEKAPESLPVHRQWTPGLIQRLLNADQARIKAHIRESIRSEVGSEAGNEKRGVASPFGLEEKLEIDGSLGIDRAMRLDLQNVDLAPLCDGSVLVAGFPATYKRWSRRLGQIVGPQGTTHKQYLAVSVADQYEDLLRNIFMQESGKGINILGSPLPRVSIISSGHMLLELAKQFHERGLPGPAALMDASVQLSKTELVEQIQSLGADVHFADLASLGALDRQQILELTKNDVPNAIELTSETLAEDIREAVELVEGYDRILAIDDNGTTEDVSRAIGLLPRKLLHIGRRQKSSSRLGQGAYSDLLSQIAAFSKDERIRLHTLVVPVGSGHLFETVLYQLLLETERSLYMKLRAKFNRMEKGRNTQGKEEQLERLRRWLQQRYIHGFKAVLKGVGGKTDSDTYAFRLIGVEPSKNTQVDSFLYSPYRPFFEQTLKILGRIESGQRTRNVPEIIAISDEEYGEVLNAKIASTPELRYSLAACKKASVESRIFKKALVIDTGSV